MEQSEQTVLANQTKLDRLPQAVQADVTSPSGATDAATAIVALDALIVDFNALLAKLRLAGVIRS